MTTLPDLLPAALDLPTVSSLNPGLPAVLVLENGTVVRLADLPAPCLTAAQADGIAVLLTNWRSSDAPAYRVPASLVAALRGMLTSGQPVPLPPLLLAASFTDTEARFTVQQGQGLDLVAPVPLMVGMTEHDHGVTVTILDLGGCPLFTFSAAKDSPALLTICREMLADGADHLAPMPAVLSAADSVLVVEGSNGHAQRLQAEQLTSPRLLLHWTGGAALQTGADKEEYFVPPELVEAVKQTVPSAAVETVPQPEARY